MLNRMLTETVGLVATGPGGRDDFGNDLPGTETVTDVPAWVEPATTQADPGLREQQVTFSYWVFIDDHVSVNGVTHVDWRGQRYAIRGKPLLQPGGFTLSGYTKLRVEHEED